MEKGLSRTQFLDKALEAYSNWYDIERKTSINIPLVATASFHEHQTGFALVRKAEMWSADRHEYVFIYSIPTLDIETFNKCIEDTRSRGDQLVDPVFGHMCTNVVTLFICDNATDDALKALKKYRYIKSFLFSLKGWLDAHTAAVILDDSNVCCNFSGRQTGEFMKKLLLRLSGEQKQYKLFKIGGNKV